MIGFSFNKIMLLKMLHKKLIKRHWKIEITIPEPDQPKIEFGSWN